MKRVQTVSIPDSEKKLIAPIMPTGSPCSAEINFKLKKLPEGDWHMRALTNVRPLEIPADSITVDQETLETRATFSNYNQFEVQIISVVIDVVD